MERLHLIYMVQRQTSHSGEWSNVKAFVSEKRAVEYLKNCISVSRNNMMRIEQEILIA